MNKRIVSLICSQLIRKIGLFGGEIRLGNSVLRINGGLFPIAIDQFCFYYFFILSYLF